MSVDYSGAESEEEDNYWFEIIFLAIINGLLISFIPTTEIAQFVAVILIALVNLVAGRLIERHGGDDDA